MVCFRSIASHAPFKVLESRYIYDTDLRSVGVISPSARKQATLRKVVTPPLLAKSIRAHLGGRDMGPMTQGDQAAALLAAALKHWDGGDLNKVFELFGVVYCRVTRSQIMDRWVIVHAGGTALLSQAGYIRPASLQVWAQEFTLSQIREQSLIGWCVNGLMRNESLELLEIQDMVTEKIHIPAADMVTDWWLRSEGMNNWKNICDNLQWGGVLPLAILLCFLDRDSEDLEFKEAIADRKTFAQQNAGLVAAAVARQLESKLKDIV